MEAKGEPRPNCFKRIFKEHWHTGPRCCQFADDPQQRLPDSCREEACREGRHRWVALKFGTNILGDCSLPVVGKKQSAQTLYQMFRNQFTE